MNALPRWLTLVSLILTFVGPTPLLAEPTKPEGDNQQKRQQLKERIRTVRTIRLVENLKLDEPMALQVSKIMNQYEDKQLELGKKKKEQLENLRKQLKEEKPNEADLQRSVADLLRLDDDYNHLHRAEFQELSKLLSPIQEAKFILFRQDFNRAVGDVIRHGRNQKSETKPGDKLAPTPHSPEPAKSPAH